MVLCIAPTTCTCIYFINSALVLCVGRYYVGLIGIAKIVCIEEGVVHPLCSNSLYTRPVQNSSCSGLYNQQW